VWDEIREKEFPNRVFSDMAGVVRTLARLSQLEGLTMCKPLQISASF